MSHALLVIVLQLASAGNDAYWTNHNMHLPRHYENNPITSPFVRTTGGCVAYFSVQTGIKLAVPRLLRRRGHNKLATTAEWLGIADNAASGTFSAMKARQ